MKNKKKNDTKIVKKKVSNKKKKKNKAFTLIELLAVIIILGVLMIIAIPSVTTYISNSRKTAYIDTAKQVIFGARNLVNEGRLEMYSTDSTYYIKASCIKTENGGKEGAKSPFGDFIDDDTYVVVTYSGTGYDYYWVSRDTAGLGVPEATKVDELDIDDIKSNLELGDVRTKPISVEKFNVLVTNNSCNSYEKADVMIYPKGKTKTTVEIGDIVTIGTEDFYVIKTAATNNDDLVLLSRYNLKVGNICNNNYLKIGEYTSSDPGYGFQSREAKGWGPGNFNGTIAFTDENYWVSSTSNYPADISLNGSYLKKYIDDYKEKLEKMTTTNIKEIRLIKNSEVVALGCNQSSLCNNAPKFVSETSYWIGTAKDEHVLWVITSDGNYYANNYVSNDIYGIRPVIII